MSVNLESVAAQLASLERQKDSAYMERNQVVAALAKLFPAGVARTPIDGWDPAWTNCVFIDLPTGQASWHYHDSEAHLFAGLPPYAGVYDGHTTPEKYARLAALPGFAGWLMCGPDGSRFTGPTPYRAAAAANRHWARLAPTAAQQLAEACAALRSDVGDATAAPSTKPDQHGRAQGCQLMEYRVREFKTRIALCGDGAPGVMFTADVIRLFDYVFDAAPADAPVTCGHGCHCLTQCGDTYDHSGNEKPPTVADAPADAQHQPKGTRPMPSNALAAAVCTVEEARGFVAFGAGVYRVCQTVEPGLVVTFRRPGEEDRAVGERTEAPDLTPIPPEEIIVRLQFTSPAGLDSLEDHLREIRAEHWPHTVQTPAPAQPADLRFSWMDFQQIGEVPAVDEAIRNLLDDQTEDNGVCMIRAICEAAADKLVALAAAQAPAVQHGKEHP